MPWLATDVSSLVSFVIALAILWLSLALGRRVLIVLGASGETSITEQAVIALGVGAGVLQFVPFALGLAGFLTPTSLRLAFAVIFLAAATDLRAVAAGLIAAARHAERPSPWMLAWLIALSPALMIAVLFAFAPSIDPDGLGYHLTVPKRWMSTGRLDYLPTYPYSNAPMGVEMLFAIGLALSGDVAAKCIHCGLGFTAIAAIYLTGKRLSGPMAGAVPATLFLIGPGGAAAILGAAYVEGAAAHCTAGSALSWLVWYQTNNRGYLRSAALLAGVAVSFKISAVFFPAALMALTAVVVITKAWNDQPAARRGRFVVACFLSTAMLVPLVAAPVLPWFTRALVVTGNPVFPLLANVISSRDLSPALATQMDRYNRYMTWGHGFSDSWTLEQRMGGLMVAAAVVALLGGLVFFKLRDRTARGAVVVLTIAVFAQLSAAGLYLRYWLPISAALMVPIAAALAPILSRRVVMVAWVGLTLLGSLAQAGRTLNGFGNDPAGLVRTVVGLESRKDFLRARLSLFPLYELINNDLPAGAGIMLSGYCGGFYIDRRTFCAEMVQDSLRFTTWQDFTEDLRRLRITHVMAPSVLATGGPTPDLGGSSVSVITRAGQFRLLRQLLETHARTVATASDQGLYEIAPALLAAR